MSQVAHTRAVTTAVAHAMRVSWAAWRSPVRLGLSLVGVAMLVLVFSRGGAGYDFYAYWAVDAADPYTTTAGLGAFHYAPPLVWLAGPLRLLPFDVGYIVWTGLMALLLVWTTRSWALAWCAFPPVASELYHGNIHLLMAAALVVGFRHTSAWAFLPLGKVTAGVIGLWPLVRRDWRGLSAFLGATTGIVLLSVAAQGVDVWYSWLDHLMTRAGLDAPDALISIPLLVRLPLAVAVAVWGAVTDRRWICPIAVTLALPLLWWHSLVLLVACQPLYATASGTRGPRDTAGLSPS